MYRVTIILLLCTLFSPFVDFSFKITQPCYVIKVYDGDTFKCRARGEVLTIRMSIIDAPELGQKSLDGVSIGELSLQFLADQILHKTVEVLKKGKDQYDRQLGLVEHKGEDISQLMLLHGMAIIYPYYKFENRDMRLRSILNMMQSVRNKRGIWATKGFINPIVHRRQKKISKILPR